MAFHESFPLAISIMDFYYGFTLWIHIRASHWLPVSPVRRKAVGYPLQRCRHSKQRLWIASMVLPIVPSKNET